MKKQVLPTLRQVKAILASLAFDPKKDMPLAEMSSPAYLREKVALELLLTEGGPSHEDIELAIQLLVLLLAREDSNAAQAGS